MPHVDPLAAAALAMWMVVALILVRAMLGLDDD